MGSHRVSAAQLQGFFVTHRKCTAAEAIANVGSIVKCIEKRKQEEVAEETKEPAKNDDGAKTKAVASDATQGNSTGKQGNSSGQGVEARTVHVHIHSCDQ